MTSTFWAWNRGAVLRGLREGKRTRQLSNKQKITRHGILDPIYHKPELNNLKKDKEVTSHEGGKQGTVVRLGMKWAEGNGGARCDLQRVHV